LPTQTNIVSFHTSCKIQGARNTRPDLLGNCVCVVQKLKIDWAKKKAQPLTRFSWNSLKKQDLILIGDEHTYSDPAAALSLIKQMVTNSGKQCIFFELASSKTVQDLRTMVNTQSEDVQTDNLRKYFKSLLEGADALGIKAHLVDDPQSLGDPWHAPLFNKETGR
jgi:hypothetical protein